MYGLVLLLSLRHWVRFDLDFSKNFPIIPFQDSGYYLGQIEGFRSGLRGFGNPFYYEHKDDGFGYGSSALLAFWGYIGKILHINIIQTYLFLTVVTGILTVLTAYLFIKTFISNRLLAIATSAFTIFTICGTSLGRPSPTQLTLWIVFLLLRVQHDLIFGFERYKSRFILYLLLLMFLTFSNPFYAVFVGFNHVLNGLFNLDKRDFKQRIGHLAALLLCFIPYLIKLMTKQKFEEAQAARFGLIHSHLPGAFKISLLILTLLFALYFFSSKKDSTYRWIIILLISIFATLNSQIFTGIHYEMESHLSLLAKIILLTVAVFLFFSKAKYSIIYSVVIGILAISGNVWDYSVIFNNQVVSEPKNELHLLKLIRGKVHPGDVLLYQNSKIPIDSQEMISVLTSTYIYFSSAGNLSRSSDKEILKRLACGYLTHQNSLDEAIQQAYLHRFHNERLMFSKWDRLLNKVGLDIYDPNIELSRKESDLNFVLRYQKTRCKTKEFKSDYLVTPDFQILEDES